MASTLPAHPLSDGDARWRALVEGSPFYVAVFGPDRRLVFLNRTRGRRPPSDFVGRSAGDLLPLGDGVQLDAVLERVMASGRPERAEVPAEVDHQTIWLELNVLPLGADPGGAIVLGRDVTEAKQAALELRMTVNALHRAIEAKEQLEADLHDGTLQSLYGVGLRLEAARAALVAAGGEADVHLDRAVDQIRSTMAEIRRYIAEGSGALPASVRWDEALTGLLRGLEVDGGPRIELELDRRAIGRVAGPGRSEIAFIAREAVSNAVRHSGASRIVVRLLDDGTQVRLEIEDDGVGFPPKPGREGLGLLTMTRRAAQIGGGLTVQTAPGRGTLIRLDLPLPDSGRADD